MTRIKVIADILESNARIARQNAEIFNEVGLYVINLMGSPGAGKTSLLEWTVKTLREHLRIGVIEGDIQSSIDAERISRQGIKTVQINTGGACHLDANMVSNALGNMPLSDIELLFIENVGNLVCPASYDVGTHLNIVLVSIPEGEDKIAKYPVMFRQADLILITKTDLLPYFKYDIEAEKKEARRIKPNVDILEININDIDSVKAVADWIEFKRKMRG